MGYSTERNGRVKSQTKKQEERNRRLTKTSVGNKRKGNGIDNLNKLK